MVTQAVIDTNMAHAVDNGYFGDIAEWTVELIVADLLAYAVDCEDSSAEELTPFVQTWYDARLKSGEIQ